MLDPQPDLYTLINVCAGAYRNEPAFAEKILDAFCTCIAARGGNTDRFRALYECGRLPTPAEAADVIVREPGRVMEFARARAEAWKYVLAGIEGIGPDDYAALSVIWEMRMRLFRIRDPNNSVLTVPDPRRRHLLLREAYRAAGRADRRMHAAATTQLDILDARIFEMLTGIPVVISETDDDQPLVVSPIPAAELLAAGFPTDEERRAWWDRNGP